MKILIVSSISSYGGTRTYLANLLQYLGKKNIEVSIGTESPAVVNDLFKELDIKDVRVHQLTVRPIWITRLTPYFHLPTVLFQYFSTKRLVAQINPDILFISPVGPGTYLSSLMLKISKVMVVHSYPRATLPLTFRIIKSIAPGDVTYLTVSRYASRAIKKYWDVPVTHIYNPPMTYKKSKVTKKKKYILTVGHMEWYKDPETWIKVARRVRELEPSFPYKFLWVGSGSQKQNIQHEIESQNLSGMCELVDSRRNLGGLYQSSYLYLQPSLMESQGIAVATAMKEGIPCVVSRVGGLPEMVIDKVAGCTVKPKNYNQMAKNILKLVNNQASYQNMSDNSIKHISTLTSKSKWEQAMDKILSTVQ